MMFEYATITADKLEVAKAKLEEIAAARNLTIVGFNATMRQLHGKPHHIVTGYTTQAELDEATKSPVV